MNLLILSLCLVNGPQELYVPTFKSFKCVSGTTLSAVKRNMFITLFILYNYS